MKEYYFNFKYTQLARYFGLPFYDIGHPNFKINDTNGEKYYWDLSSKVDYELNLINNLPGRVYDGEVDFSPINIAQYGIALLDKGYLENAEAINQVFNWICNNIEINNDIGIIYLKYPVPCYSIEKGFKSGLAQGLLLSFLSRYYQITKNQEALDLAELIFPSLILPIKSGGVCSNTSGIRIIEEYVSETPSSVLNGHISGIWGIIDYYKVLKQKSIKSEMDSYLSSLPNILHKWDGKYWTYYDLYNPKTVSSPFYQELHYKQMYILWELTGNEVYHDYYVKWKYQNQNFLNRMIAIILRMKFEIEVKS